MHNLHPGAKWIFRFGAYVTLIVPAIILSSFFNSFIMFSQFSTSHTLPTSPAFNIILYFIFTILFILIIGEIYARMTYNRWLFEFTETNLKEERGIIWKKYSNIPYERVQNVDIRRGILARIFGFSSVMIQTAGYSYGGRGGLGAEGYLPAVSPKFAEEIRDYVMHKISKKGGSGGLG